MDNFRVEIPQPDVHDLRARLTQTRWPSQSAADGWRRGVPVAALRSLVEYWATEFDWRAVQARLNAFPQFTDEIDGERIHFAHVRSENPDALPLLLIHGWPSTFAEFADVIEPLSRHHHVVVPSIPGFGFSGTGSGWETNRTAAAFAELMKRLGYPRYGIQGGDVGSGIAGAISRFDPDAVVAMHINGPSAHPFMGPMPTDGLEGMDLVRAERFNDFVATGIGYLQLMATKPWTIGYSLTDSPVGLLAWIAEKFQAWTDAGSGHEFGVDRDALLTTASIYWFTGTGATSAEFLYESMNTPGAWGAATAPTGFATFAADNGVRTLIDPDHQIAHWTEYDAGGHFPAVEVPELFTLDVTAFFKSFS